MTIVLGTWQQAEKHGAEAVTESSYFNHELEAEWVGGKLGMSF